MGHCCGKGFNALIAMYSVHDFTYRVPYVAYFIAACIFRMFVGVLDVRRFLYLHLRPTAINTFL